MKAVDNVIKRLDNWQQHHRGAALTYAVIKRYGEAEMGYQAALLTYYSFWSLFPLLLVLTTLATLLSSHHPGLEHDVVKATTSYFPVLGNQLSAHISTLH